MSTDREQLYFGATKLQVGFNSICNPNNSALTWLHIGRLWLPEAKQTCEAQSGVNEVVLTLLYGSGTLEIKGGPRYSFGPRANPFNDASTMIYLPPDCEYRVVSGDNGLDMLTSAAPANSVGEPLLLTPDMIRRQQVGAGRWARRVTLGTVGDFPIQRLMVGETVNRAGGWTSFPPHKHDEVNPPGEMPYEEIYFFLFEPKLGFAIQSIYDAPDHPEPLRETIMVKAGDTVVIPHGYHPVVGLPGYRMFYVWAMCGNEGHRKYGQVKVDPDHEWLGQVEAVLEDYPLSI